MRGDDCCRWRVAAGRRRSGSRRWGFSGWKRGCRGFVVQDGPDVERSGSADGVWDGSRIPAGGSSRLLRDGLRFGRWSIGLERFFEARSPSLRSTVPALHRSRRSAAALQAGIRSTPPSIKGIRIHASSVLIGIHALLRRASNHRHHGSFLTRSPMVLRRYGQPFAIEFGWNIVW